VVVIKKVVEKIFSAGFAVGAGDANGGEIGMRGDDLAGIGDGAVEIDDFVGLDE